MITSRGMVALSVTPALGVTAALYGVEEFALVAVAVAMLLITGAMAVGWRSRVAGRSLDVAVRTPPEVVTGAGARADLIVTNSGVRTSSPLWAEDPEEAWSLSHPGLSSASTYGHFREKRKRPRHENQMQQKRRSTADTHSPTPLPALRPTEKIVTSFEMPTGSRGLLTLRPVVIWVEDPFRLFSLKVASSPAAHVLVLPDVDNAVSSNRRSSGQEGRQGGHVIDQPHEALVAPGHDFRTVRPYRDGDRLSRLHWPALARTEELMVRDFGDPVTGRTTLLLDLRESVHEGDSLEATVSRVARLGGEALRSDELVELCTSSGERVDIQPGPGSTEQLLRMLAVVDVSADAHWPTPVSSVAGGLSGGILVTTRRGSDQAVPRELVGHLEEVLV